MLILCSNGEAFTLPSDCVASFSCPLFPSRSPPSMGGPLPHSTGWQHATTVTPASSVSASVRSIMVGTECLRPD